MSATATQPSPGLAPAASRATASALRLPAEPPLTKQPPASAGNPARSDRNRSTSFSACTAPAASSQLSPENVPAVTAASNRAETTVGAAGMKARKRGLSRPMVAGTMTSVEAPERLVHTEAALGDARAQGRIQLRGRGGGADGGAGGQAVGHEAVDEGRCGAGLGVEAVH